MLDLPYLARHISDDPELPPRFKKLNEAMADVLDDFSMLSFQPLNIQASHS